MDESLQAKLLPLRQRIDRIDAEILDLLNQRANTAMQVGEIKHEHHAEGPVLRPEREAQVIRQLQSKNRGPFPSDAVASVWTEIISACRGLERALTVAFLGPTGSFSEQAALEHFGHAVTGLPCPSFDEVFRSVESGAADVGMVPVENSTEGAVNRTLDLLLGTTLRILGERSLLIHHCLMAQDASMKGVTRIMAHPQALAQCQQWLTRITRSLLESPCPATQRQPGLLPRTRPLQPLRGMLQPTSGDCPLSLRVSRMIHTIAPGSWRLGKLKTSPVAATRPA